MDACRIQLLFQRRTETGGTTPASRQTDQLLGLIQPLMSFIYGLVAGSFDTE